MSSVEEQGKMIAAYSGGCEYRDLVRFQGTHECDTGFETESSHDRGFEACGKWRDLTVSDGTSDALPSGVWTTSVTARVFTTKVPTC